MQLKSRPAVTAFFQKPVHSEDELPEDWRDVNVTSVSPLLRPPFVRGSRKFCFVRGSPTLTTFFLLIFLVNGGGRMDQVQNVPL